MTPGQIASFKAACAEYSPNGQYHPAASESPSQPVIRRGAGVTLVVSDCPDPVFGVVVDVYTNAIGDEVANIDLGHRGTAHQCVRFLTVVRPAVAS